MKIIAVIPARYESTRFRGKVLAKDTGKFLVQHTWENLRQTKLINNIIIAADNEKVLSACKSFNAHCVMTKKSHQSGTDRIAEAVKNIEADIVINVQADEPETAPANIDLLAQLLIDNPKANMATLIAKFERKEQISDPNIVKVVIDKDKYAKYFSRAIIPYNREAGGLGKIDDYLRHIGMYAYRKDFLMQITELPQTKLEKLEKLEQLRVLEHGFSILTGLVTHCKDGIDTEKQYKEFVKREKC